MALALYFLTSMLLSSSAPVSYGTTAPVVPDAAPLRTDDSPAAARGQRILSTAFVRIGPAGHLSVGLRDGRTVILRDVKMGSAKFCGVPASGSRSTTFCGRYDQVVSARAGGGSATPEPVSTRPNPLKTPRAPD